MNAWCGGKAEKAISPTAPNTPEPSHDDSEDNQFFIDADLDTLQQEKEQQDFWNRFLSLLWILLAAKYWGGGQGAPDPVKDEKSAPPVLSTRTEATVLIEEEDAST